MKWRVNILALVAAIIGIVAVFSVWLESRMIFWSVDFNLIDILNKADDGLVLAGCWLFLIGAIVCFISPVGGLLEVFGVILFFTWFVSETEGDMPSRMGSYIGIASAVIAFVSIAKPIGLGYSDASAGAKGRLLVFSRVSGSATPQATSTERGQFCRVCGKPVSAEDEFCKSCGRKLT